MRRRFSAKPGLLIAVIAAPLVLFAPLYLTGKALFWGTPLLQFIPWWDFAWSTLRAGHLPLWNPYLGLGAPLLANYQTALLYPPNWLYFILHLAGGVPLMAWGISLVVALHLVWAGFGMSRLAHRLGLEPLGQAVAGLAFGLCGYLVARSGFLSINAAAAWLPWVILCLTPSRWGEPIPARQRLMLSLCIGMALLAGHAQTTWYTLLLAALWAAFLGWQGAYADVTGEGRPASWKVSLLKSSKRVGRAWAVWAVSLALAIGLAAAQLLPTAEYLTVSHRAEAVDYGLAMTYSFWPWRLLGLVAPDLYGNPAQGDYWGYANYWEDAIYIGLLPFLLAAGALLAGFRRRERLDMPLAPPMSLKAFAASRVFRRFLLTLFGLALILALGQNTPVYPWLYRHVPTFDLFQAPSRWMIWAEFALALAAGLGAQSWRRPVKRGLYWTRLGTAGAFAISLGAGLTWLLLGDVRSTFIRAASLAGLWAVGAGLLSLLAPVRDPTQISEVSQTSEVSRPGIWQWAVVFFVGADLLVAGYGLNPGISLEVYRPSAVAERIRSQANGNRLYISQGDEQEVKYKRFLRFDTFDPGEDWVDIRSFILPNLNLLDRIASANNFDPLLPGRYARLMEFVSGLDGMERQRYLEWMDVGLVESLDPTQPYGVRFDPIPGAALLHWVGCVLPVANSEAAWDLVAYGDLDFNTRVVLESPGAAAGVCPGMPGEFHFQILRRSPNRLEVQVTIPDRGMLVISNTRYPGWRIWIDGEPASLLPADYLFQSVQIEKGEHRVILQYRPAWFWLGAAVSFISLIAFFWRAFVERRR